MNWRLIFQLSLFGLAMGLATVFVIPSSIEPIFWLAIICVCAYLIARARATGQFIHGLALGIANSVWVTGAHVLLFGQYVARHAKELDAMSSVPMANRPRLVMALVGPVIGVISGVVIGLFAYVAGRFVKPAETMVERRRAA
jgi:hypothetical protein